MILAIDIGNTKTAAGLVEGTDVRVRASAPTDARAAVRAIWAELQKALGGKPRVKGAIVCSVVPKATAPAMAAIRAWSAEHQD